MSGQNLTNRSLNPAGMGMARCGANQRAVGRNSGTDITKVVACLQCRSRKVRCDAGQPKCNNCTTRFENCEYVLRKIRGPDKQPGRVRMFWKKPEGPSDLHVNRSKSKRPKNKDKDNNAVELDRIVPDSVRKSISRAAVKEVRTATSPSTSSTSGTTISTSKNNTDTPVDPAEMVLYRSSSRHSSAFTYFDIGFDLDAIPRGPSVMFNKQTWWDTLLQTYCEDPLQSSHKISQDITFLFNKSPYFWCPSIHLPLFFEKLYDPIQRSTIQPSLVFAALALTILMKSYEGNLGEKGRRKALALRDAAQSSLEASISAGWIDTHLAQAALLLTLFEAGTYECHTPARTSSAIFLLDSLIHALGLLLIDVHEPNVSIFPANEVPVASTNTINLNELSAPLHICQSLEEDEAIDYLNSLPEGYFLAYPSDVRSPNSVRSTKSITSPYSEDSTERNDQGGRCKRKSMINQPPWPSMYNKTEVEKEEARRLCWNALTLVTTFQEHTPYLQQQNLDLHVTKQENFAIFFPVESRYHSPDESHSTKDTIWALHCRSILLSNFCGKVQGQSDWEHRKLELLSRAWLEAAAIEAGLTRHTDRIGKNILYLVVGFTFRIKVLTSSGFTSSIPIPYTLAFERNGVEEWLNQRAYISAIVRKTMNVIANSNGVRAGDVALELAKRPLGIWWTLYQIHSGTMSWKLDPRYKQALEQSLDFVAFAEFMLGMWPSPAQEQYLTKLKDELFQACRAAGITVPGAVYIPGLRPNAKITMPLSIWNSNFTSPLSSRPKSRSADIPILPVD